MSTWLIKIERLPQKSTEFLMARPNFNYNRDGLQTFLNIRLTGPETLLFSTTFPESS